MNIILSLLLLASCMYNANTHSMVQPYTRSGKQPTHTPDKNTIYALACGARSFPIKAAHARLANARKKPFHVITEKTLTEANAAVQGSAQELEKLKEHYDSLITHNTFELTLPQMQELAEIEYRCQHNPHLRDIKNAVWQCTDYFGNRIVSMAYLIPLYTDTYARLENLEKAQTLFNTEQINHDMDKIIDQYHNDRDNALKQLRNNPYARFKAS